MSKNLILKKEWCDSQAKYIWSLKKSHTTLVRPKGHSWPFPIEASSIGLIVAKNDELYHKQLYWETIATGDFAWAVRQSKHYNIKVEQ